MKHIKIYSENNARLWKKAIQAISMTALLVGIILGNFQNAFAQFTFMGDYDKTFAPPLGYYVDPEKPIAPTVDTASTLFNDGALLADGSIVAGGQHFVSGVHPDFYLKKFTASGAVDASFGTNGFVLTNFYAYGTTSSFFSNDIPYVLKVQPDGKIIQAGECQNIGSNTSGVPGFGNDACLIRYNANGTIDESFGGFPVTTTGQGTTVHSLSIDPGRVIFQTGLIANGQRFGTNGKFYDMTILPDGKILLVGETGNYAHFFGFQGYGAIVVRLNPNGSLDSTFGSGGIARWTVPEGPANCFPPRAFYGVRLQPDGRIIAVGFNSVSVCNGSSAPGNRFVVTRWTAAGQLETVRHLDNNTAFNFQDEGASNVHFTRDGSKILVSGAYKNLSGSSPPHLLTMVRFNLSDLSIDTTFAGGGIRQHSSGCGSVSCGFLSGGRLQIKAIQPDGKILAVDGATSGGNVVRYNPDGTLDQSFGNGINGAGGLLGRLRVLVLNYNGFSAPIEAGQILVRPNGRINLLGYSAAHSGLGILRAVVSQQNTVLKNGNYSDFTNDGKTEIAVFRPSNGAWYQLNSANGAFSGVLFGFGTDKPVPADYDGDGKTDVAVFRDGFWYYLQSSDGAFKGLQFGSPEDLPRPGDFDGDGKADIAVFRPSNGSWYYLRSSDNQFVGLAFGQNGDVPLLADFDGDGKSDIAVFRGGFWYYLQSSNGEFRGLQFGLGTDIPTVGDYDGDGKSDISVFRNGNWYRLNSSTGAFVGFQWGQSGDKPTAADYDGDGKTDFAVFRSGNWYVLNSGNNSFFGTAFGFSTDVPIPSVYLP